MARLNYYLLTRGWMENKALAGEKFCKRSAWAWLIERAAFRDTSASVGGVHVDLKRGQVAVSIRFLARAWGWGDKRVQRFLGVLRSVRMVTTEATTGVTVITLCNYDRYQFPVEVATTPATTEATTPTTTNKKEANQYSVGAPPEISITKVLFDSAVSYLGQNGRNEKEARALCAKWINSARSWSPQPELQVIDAIDRAKKAGKVDPVSFVFDHLQRQRGASAPRRAGGEL
jgi:hypothetical protein